MKPAEAVLLEVLDVVQPRTSIHTDGPSRVDIAMSNSGGRLNSREAFVRRSASISEMKHVLDPFAASSSSSPIW